MTTSDGDEDAKAIAKEAVRRARLARGFGPAHRGDLTPAQKALRDAAIVLSSHAGVEKQEIARQFGITPRAVYAIEQAARAERSPLGQVPLELIERLLREYESQMRRFAVVAVDTIERAPSAAVAALRGEADALERYVAVLSALGKLPRNLEVFRTESEVRRVAFAMLDAIKAAQAGEMSLVELRLFFERGAWEQPQAPEALPELGAGEDAA